MWAQADLDTLAAVCQLGNRQSSQSEQEQMATQELSNLSGPALLTWLHDRLQDADASTTPILQVTYLTSCSHAAQIAAMPKFSQRAGCH